VKQFQAQRLITAIRCALDDSHLLAAAKLPDSPINQAMIKTIKPYVSELLECCRSADLRLASLSLERTLTFMDSTLRTTLIAENLVDSVKRSIMTVEDELSLRLFLALEPREADYYNKPWEGWEKVVERFGDTTRDVEEMSKCFALSRYTASMFHALHVAEWGAIKLGEYIGVTDPKKGWGPTERKLAELVKAGHSRVPSALSGHFDFLEQMNREINSMVLAWRHKVDHVANHLSIVPNVEFTPDIAEHIIGSVKVFMTRLMDGIPT